MHLDFQPAPPAKAYFDSVRRSWILSRYSDVYAGLREPILRQVSPNGEFLVSGDDAQRHAELYTDIQTDMARMSSAEWRQQIEATASTLIQNAAGRHPVNIVRTVIQPWSSAMLIASSGIKAAQAPRVTKLLARMFFPTDRRRGPITAMTPIYNLPSRFRSWNRRRAQAEMGRILTTQNLALSRSMLTGLTQTLPSFLAKAWLALLQNPDQAAILLAEPDLIPGAVEELLRYAGIVHSLYRRAASDVCIGDTQIAANDHVTLRLGSANFDPEQFHEPRRLDIARRRLGHVGLGTGPHNCVGAVLVRMATAVTTPIFLAAAPVLDTSIPIIWTGDDTLRWPSVVSAWIGSKETANVRE